MVYCGDERCEEREEYDAQGDGIVTDEEYSRQRNERQSEAERRRGGLVELERPFIELRREPRAAEVDYRQDSRQQDGKRRRDIIFFFNKSRHPRGHAVLEHTLDEYADADNRRAGDYEQLAEGDLRPCIFLNGKGLSLPPSEYF